MQPAKPTLAFPHTRTHRASNVTRGGDDASCLFVQPCLPPTQGNVTRGALTSVMPFGNQVAIVEASGADIITALYNSISVVGGSAGTGRFAQVGGFSKGSVAGQQPTYLLLRPLINNIKIYRCHIDLSS